MDIQLQLCVANLYGHNKLNTLKNLIDSEENDLLLKEDPIRHAVSYQIYYGDPDAKVLALELASKMKMLSPSEIKELAS